jgi:MoxR-vWA-beta-propeller ternary system domain bpX5
MNAAQPPLAWHRREPPLPPSAVVAKDDAVLALARATARRLDDGTELRVSAQNAWLLVLGAADDLPWAPDVTYLGWDSGVLVPSTLECFPPADLVRRALSDRLPHPGALVVILGADVLVTELPARTADAAQLRSAG